MLDEVLRERLGVGDELVGDHVGGLPAALVERVVGRGRAHRGVPHRQRELLVAERPGAVERVGRAHRDAHDPGVLRLAAGRPAEVEVAGRHDQLGALVDQLDRGVADRHRVGLAVDVEEAHRLAEQAAGIVDLLDRDLGALEPGLVERRLQPVRQIAPPIRISALAGAATARSPASDSPNADFGRCLILFPSWSWLAPRRRRAGARCRPIWARYMPECEAAQEVSPVPGCSLVTLLEAVPVPYAPHSCTKRGSSS